MGVGLEGLFRLTRFGFIEELNGLLWAETKPHNGYRYAVKSSTGIVVMSHPDRPKMGTHIVMSGDTLKNTEYDTGLTPKKVLQWYRAMNWKVTRLDVAVDFYNSGLEVPEIARLVSEGEVETKARSAPYINDPMTGGETQYIGSLKNRTKLFRYYNKASQQGVELDWKRAELALYSDNAMIGANEYLDSESEIDAIVGLIKGYVDFPTNETWNKIMSSSEIKIPVPEKVQGDTEKWLIEQVAPSMVRVLELNPSFWEKFLEAVGK